MFAQSFSVISHHNNHCSLIPPLFLEVSKEVTQRRIRVSNFSVVEPVLVNIGIRRRRLVRIVWIVEVHPNEVCTGWVRVEPCFCALLYFHTSALNASPPGLSCCGLWEVIVELETTIEAGREILAVEDHSAYECRSAVALFREQCCQGGMCSWQRNAEVADSVRARQKPSHNARVRAISNGAGCECLSEVDSLLR